MLDDKLTLVIFSCEKFSDLWDGQVRQLEKFWPQRTIETYIVTDEKTEKKYESVKIICAGKGSEFSERVRKAVEHSKTEYVFVTLDDYFLIKNVENKRIEELIEIMDNEKIDYMRLYLRYKKSNKGQLKDYAGIHMVDPSYRYSVNLYPGIWRKSFLEKTIKEERNPWQFEVALPQLAVENHAVCAMSKRNEYVFLDVVRKGKILNKANRYFKKYDVYHGERQVHSRIYEIRLGVKTLTSRYLPTWLVKRIKKIMQKLGYEFYS